MGGSSSGGFGADPTRSMGSSSGVYSGVSVDTPAEPPKPTFSAAPRKPMTSKAMKLGGKSKDVDSFVDQLKSEGEHVTSDISRSSVTGKKTAKVSAVQQVKAERYVFDRELANAVLQVALMEKKQRVSKTHKSL